MLTADNIIITAMMLPLGTEGMARVLMKDRILKKDNVDNKQCLNKHRL